MKKRAISFPTIIGVLVILVGMIVGVILLRNPIFSLAGASPEEAPKQVKITNITDSEFVVSWTTDRALAGFIQYGETTPDLVVSDDRDQERGSVSSFFTHYVTVKNLKPSTKYHFKIGSGKGIFDQQGEFYEISTGPILRNPPTADVAYGQVTTESGDPAEGALVYLHLPGIVPQAALVKSSGSWVIPLATARTTDLTSFAPYDRESDKLELFVQAGSLGTAQTITTTGQDSPVPVIVLGQNQDLTAAPIGGTTTTTTPAVQPTGAPLDQSRFSAVALSEATESTGAAVLTILTPKFEETVNTDQPEIIGKAPAGAEISIEIHSDQVITDTIITDADGNWSYSVPENLTPGEHTITISTLIDGVIKKVTRSFTVSAAGETNDPAFVATPSATLNPSPSPTLKPSTTPIVTATPLPTIVPRVAIPSTDSGVPQSGNLTPTLLLAILGLGLITGGIFSYKLKIN